MESAGGGVELFDDRFANDFAAIVEQAESKAFPEIEWVMLARAIDDGIRRRTRPATPRVTPELRILCRTSDPSGRRAIQSVNVPPTSIQNCHGGDMRLVGLRLFPADRHQLALSPDKELTVGDRGSGSRLVSQIVSGELLKFARVVSTTTSPCHEMPKMRSPIRIGEAE